MLCIMFKLSINCCQFINYIHIFTMHNTNLIDIVLRITTTDSKIKFGDREGKQIEIKKLKIDSLVTMDLNTGNIL